MSNLAEKRHRFELLMKQADIPIDLIDSFFLDGYIDRVETSRTNREWTFYIHKQKLLPQDAYSLFCKTVQERFQHIAKIHFVIQYAESVDDHRLIEEYWNLFIAWVKREVASVNGWMSNAIFDYDGGKVTLTLLDATSKELARKKNIDERIVQFYERFFCRTYKVDLQVKESSSEEYEKFAQLKEREERTVVQDIISSVGREAEAVEPVNKDAKLTIGYEIKDHPVPIQDIKDEEKKVAIQGTVFNL